jgi:hypothetical protein
MVVQRLHTAQGVGSNPTITTNQGSHMEIRLYIVGLILFAVLLIGTGEVLDCVMFVNPHEHWCD